MPVAKLPIAVAITATLVLAPAALAQAPASIAGGAAFSDPQEPAGGLQVEPGSLLGGTLEISGVVAGAASGPVRVERQDPTTHAWVPVARGRADDDGRFSAVWETDVVGVHPLRAVPDGPGQPQATAAATLAAGSTTVYRPAKATWYGPGFWGRFTACGVRLTKTTLGVAHKSLPCGTRVSLFFGGRQIEVPVIDRGPFARGLSFDLTQAAAQQLGMLQTSRIGWVRPLPAAPPAA
jgi:rare lipoprotein A